MIIDGDDPDNADNSRVP